MTDVTVPPPGAGAETGGCLSPREMEVLQLVTEALTNGEIALRLGVGEETVKTHLNRVMWKLDARNRLDAAMKSVQLGLVTLNDRPSVTLRGLPGLSPREASVLELICFGMSQQQVADRLGLAFETVKTTVHCIRARWHARSTVEIVQLARENGLVTGPAASPMAGSVRGASHPLTNWASCRRKP
jgi:DNA-binding NarL/FixJ family response regulator